MENKTTTYIQDVKELKELFKKLDTWIVYGQVLKVSSSGMSRRIRFYIADPTEGRILDITTWFQAILGGSCNNYGLLVHGVGMDMIFDSVYRLSCRLYNDGYRLKSQSL